eukprot:SAG22_NODE_1885_length_3376_cov_1.712542_3_plen_116_part_00
MLADWVIGCLCLFSAVIHAMGKATIIASLAGELGPLPDDDSGDAAGTASNAGDTDEGSGNTVAGEQPHEQLQEGGQASTGAAVLAEEGLLLPPPAVLQNYISAWSTLPYSPAGGA